MFFLFINFSQISTIDKHLVPDLHHLKIKWLYVAHNMIQSERLFNRDVIFSFANLILAGLVNELDTIRYLIFMVNEQCSYVLDVKWFVQSLLLLQGRSAVLLDTL